MNYLEAFLQKKRRAEKCEVPTDKTDATGSVSFVSEPSASSSTPFPRSPVPKAPILPPAVAASPSPRNPIIPPGVRSVIEAIEVDARAKGWPAELLWNSRFWDSPRGLAALIDEGDAIAEVTTTYIAILKVERKILRFQRRAS